MRHGNEEINENVNNDENTELSEGQKKILDLDKRPSWQKSCFEITTLFSESRGHSTTLALWLGRMRKEREG